MEALIHSNIEPDGVLVATIDMPGRRMNVFSAELMDALDALMDRVDADPAVRSVVLTSGKATFLAGAELSMVRGFGEHAKTATPTELRALCGRLGRQFVRLEASEKPWFAAVNGLALGGGLELALACRVRIVTDEPRTQIGVPEVRWGLLPGAGGTQRLPRLAPFEPAMAMLLGGQSVGPAEAVRLSVFAKAVPGAELLESARVIARSLHGVPYDASVKFASNGAQADVPAPDDATRRAIAAKNGISDEDFVAYPAFGAIIDSVLQGARRPLAEATEVEMTQFLTLMRSPVAGRMVRTLYLERQNADRAVVVPADLGIESIGMGAISKARDVWRAALARIKVPCTPDASLPSDTLEILDKAGIRHRVALHAVEDAPDHRRPVAVLTAAGPYGRVLEIAGASDADAVVLAALAARLSALPWRTPGPDSVLQRLQATRGSLGEQATTALVCAAQPGAGELAFFDVAACLAGVSPAWSGGPLTYFWSERASLVDALDAAGKSAWATLETRLQEACG